MEDNINNRLLLTLIGTAIGITGIVAYYESVQWLFYTCTVLSIMQWVSSIITKELQSWAYPYLAACLLAGYYFTGAFADFFCYGICLYYATGLLYIGLLYIIPLFCTTVVPAICMVAFFLHYEHVFMVTAVFCTTHFLIAQLLGKNPYFAMNVFLGCVTFGVLLVGNRNTDSLYTMRLIKGILWAGAAYYITMLFYAIYLAYTKRK